MKVVILAGGKGTRIRGSHDDLPKPLIPIGDKPIIEHVMDIYTKFFQKEFILCLGYKSWQIKEYFLNYDNRVNDIETTILRKGCRIETMSEILEPFTYKYNVILAETGENSGTGHRLLKIRKYLKNDPNFMVTYADGVSDINIGNLFTFHQSHDNLATMTGIHPRNKFGVVSTTKLQIGSLIIDGVQHFEEKPTVDDCINGGFFVFQNSDRFWQYFNDNENLSLEHGVLPNIASDGELMMYPHNGFWHCMDNYAEWQELNEIWNKNHKW